MRMAVTVTEKFGFPIASSGADPTPDRAAWMDIFQALESQGLALGHGPLSSRPSAPTSPLAWFDTDSGTLAVHIGTGGAWTNVTPLATAAPQAGAYGGTGSVGTSGKAAREDHTHPLPPITRDDLPAITAADLPTVPVSKGGTGATSLAAGSFLRGAGTSAVVTRTPSQVLADIGAAPAAAGVPSGGSTSDVLTKTADGFAFAPPVDNVEGMTDVGRAVAKAANQAAARSAIGAGTSSFDGSYTSLTNKPTIPTTAAQVGAVPTTRTVNGKALSADISLTAGDVSAVPTTRTVNGKALSANVTLAAGDVGAVPTSRTVAGKPLSADVTLGKADVGLGSVDNTADATKVVASAAKLTTARKINGVNFDGTTDITVADSTKVPTSRTVNGKALSGDVTLDSADVGAVALAAGIVVVDHDDNPDVARPAGAKRVLWFGTVEPVNATARDLWADTTEAP